MDPESIPNRSPEVELLLARARGAIEPRPERVEAALSGLRGRLAAGDVGPPLPEPMAVPPPWAVLGVIGAAILVPLAAILISHTATEPATAPVPAPVATPAAAPPAEPPPPARDPLLPAPVPAAAPSSAPAPPPAPPRAVTRKPKRATGTTTDGSAVEIELALIREAKVALGAHRPEAAREHLREHARRFPRGVFADEREVLDAEALCALGRRDEARRKARAFAKAHPDSPLGKRARTLCSGP